MTRSEILSARWLKPRYAAFGLAAVLILGIVYIHQGRATAAKETATVSTPDPVLVNVVTASIHPMNTIVNAQGTLIPAQGGSAQIAAVSAGRIISVNVQEGDHVTAGQVVATIDNSVQQAQALSADAALRASQELARQAQLAVQSASTDHANAVKVAKLELQVAETNLHKLQHGARPQQIAEADQAVNQAKATYQRASTELARTKFLYGKGIYAKRQLDDAQTGLALAEASLKSAQAKASLLRAGARPEDIHAAELSVETARANLQQAEQGSIQVMQKKQEAQAATESVQQKVADLTAAQTAARYCQLRSPISGTIIHRMLNPGDMADTSTPILEIANTRTLNISANVPGDEAASICPGMPVQVTIGNSDVNPILGNVLSVGQIDPQTGLLTARISVPNPTGSIKIGGLAEADIIVHTDRQAVVVPKEALLSQDGNAEVFLVNKNNIAHEIHVTTGVKENDLVQIVKGVTPGERVIILGQYELSDGMKVRVSKTKSTGTGSQGGYTQ